MLVRRPLRNQSGTSSGYRQPKLQSPSYDSPPVHSPIVALMTQDLALGAPSLESEQVLHDNRFPFSSSPVDHSPTRPLVVSPVAYQLSPSGQHQPKPSSHGQEPLVSHDALTTPLVPTDGPKAVQSRRKFNLAPNFSSMGSHHLLGRSDPTHEGVLASSPLSPSQDESSPAGTMGEGRGFLVTGYDISSESEISSDQNPSELVVLASQIDDCQIKSGGSSRSQLDGTSSEASYSELSPPDAATAVAFVRKRQRAKLIATIPAAANNNHGLVSAPDDVSRSPYVARPFGLGAGSTSGKTTTNVSLPPLETKYTAAGKTSSRQYGALKTIDAQTVGSSSSGSNRGSFQSSALSTRTSAKQPTTLSSSPLKGSAVNAANRCTPSGPIGLSGTGKTLHNPSSNPYKQSSSSSTSGSMHTGGGARKPPTYNNRNESGTRNPAHGARQSVASKNISSRARNY